MKALRSASRRSVYQPQEPELKGESTMHFHWQNLNERNGGGTGPGIVNGRAWWHFGPANGRPHGSTIGVQWVFHRRFEIGARVERHHVGDEHDFSGSIHLAWFSFYLHTERLMPRWWLAPGPGYVSREYKLSFAWEEWRVSWAWGGDPMSWSSRDPWWKNGSRSLKDVFFGRMKYREGEPERHRIAVQMPEGTYTGTCVMRADSWKRPLWFRRVIRRAHIDMDKGQHVPFPGKGENSWDCGEDGIYGMTCVARDQYDAAAQVAASALRSRERYGGRNWKPAARNGAA
jgi:hypothetical protein